MKLGEFGMPRKQQNDDPVIAFVSASQAYAYAKNRLLEAVSSNTLTGEQIAYYELLRDGLVLERNVRSKQKRETTPKVIHESSDDSPIKRGQPETG